MTRCFFTCAAVVGLMLSGASANAQSAATAKTPPPAAAPASGQPTASNSSPQKVSVQAWVDRTAIWVADRVTYTVEITCQPGVDILSADLAPEKLPLDGLEVIGNDIDHDIRSGDVTIYRFRYYLTTYKVDVPTLKIGAMVVRYYVKRSGQQLGDSAPLGEVQVPALSVAFRSLIPDDQQKYSIRDGAPAFPRQERYTRLEPIGIGLIVISILPAILFAAAIFRRVWQGARRTSSPQMRDEESTSLEELKSMDLTTVEGRRAAYSRMNALVRDHVSKICNVNAPNLTPAEISGALSAHGGQIMEELVSSVLNSCEQALYAPVESLPSAEACRLTMDKAGRALSVR